MSFGFRFAAFCTYLFRCALSSGESTLPNIVFFMLDDYGWANVGFHRNGTDREVVTPSLDALAKEGIILDRHYVHQFCSPTRSALQSGRSPIHVNVFNSALFQHNPADPVSGFEGIPRNMTGIATKLKSAGYSTHTVGKWHAGMATPDHTPFGRGYDTSLIYFDAANDYWTSQPENDSPSCPWGSVTDLWKNNSGASMLNNSWVCSQQNQLPKCKYEDELFMEHIVDRVNEHNASAGPFFAYVAWHNCHAPEEVPNAYLNNFSFINFAGRQTYAAKANFMDTMTGRVVAALKANGMWENTLIVASADNGGPIGNANNWPLRGGKFSNWEGGTRVNALVSGGLVPPARRGTIESGFTAIDDWYPTFCGLAKVDPTDTRAAAAGLPPIDGHDLWPLLSGANSTSPRTEVWLGTTSEYNQGSGNTTVQGIIDATTGYKLVTGTLWYATWTGPQYPNATGAAPVNFNHTCMPSCLYNVLTDPTEHLDVSASNPDVVERLTARLAEVQATAFSPDRGQADQAAGCKAALSYGGFLGPFLP